MNKNSWIAIRHWPCHCIGITIAFAATYSFWECGNLSSPCQRNTSVSASGISDRRIPSNSNQWTSNKSVVKANGCGRIQIHNKKISSLVNRPFQTTIVLQETFINHLHWQLLMKIIIAIYQYENIVTINISELQF